jgi:uncharacterized membrane protein (DUF485 family)
MDLQPSESVQDSRDFSAVMQAAKAEFKVTTSEEVIDSLSLVNLKESHEQKRQVLQNTDFAQNITLRKLFAWLTFGLVFAWMASSMVLIYCIAFNIAKLSDPVLIALITTTLATVVGLLWLVLAYLFPRASDPR